ncbi:transcriptional regulator, GntR family [Roseovarius pacificus]|uniref:Transcriptional regulator, GntR family n=1 Tax=Roseovarius pacificus TaxID=337701 RepID=A0A1M7G5I3_9RHOB|nr:GntR family transcriptional regulator [Roseovarius pacificus]GGO59654.1 GntR family transcriptional regulator [Roseovarius pacificus]SHM11530.1 transcriptional regulator, GntR family [Roseovarius pacificus]
MAKDKKSHCLEDLRMRILTQDIAPGSDLDEAALCEAYGISRTPMREVFQRLHGEGYLRLEQNRGAKVESMDLQVMRTFFQTAPVVYANISRLAAENRRSDELNVLQEIQDGFRHATQARNPHEASLLNHRFHLQIGEMAHNPYLLPSLKRMLIDHTRLSQTFYRPASADEKLRVSKACDQHDQLIVAIKKQEPALAAEITLDHWALSRDRLERFVTPDPLPLDVISMKDHRHAL